MRLSFDQEDLELAFQLHVVDLILAADLATTTAEAELLELHFPDAVLRDRGFVDALGARTAKFQDAAVEALNVLPATLDPIARNDLLSICARMALADDEFRVGEAEVLLMAARLLGMADADFDALLQARPATRGITAAFLDRMDEPAAD